MTLFSPTSFATTDSDLCSPKLESTQDSLDIVIRKLTDVVKRAVKMCGSLDDQIAFFDDQAGSFSKWFSERFEPAFKLNRERYGAQVKSLENAFNFKKMAEAYSEMKHGEAHLIERAFDYVNQAIKATPHDEANFLASCFALRCDLHLSRRSDTATSLLDVEKALRFRPHSYSCIRRKLDLLGDLKRPQDAYRFLDEIIKKQPPLKIDAEKMAKLKEKRNQLLEYAPVAEQAEQTAAKDKSSTGQSLVFADSRLSMVENKYHKRYGFFATAPIPAGTAVLRERPAMLVLKSDGRLEYCANCWRSCKDAFWPCKGCDEVIYCSEECAIQHEAEHGAECGLVNLMQTDSGNVHVMQVFRFLMQQGHEKLAQIDREMTDFKLDVLFNSIASGSSSPSSTEISQWFAAYQGTLLHRYYMAKPDRTATEITSAFLILALYLHRRGISPDSFTHDQFREMIRILSTALFSVAINEYGWTSYTDGKKRLNAAFQCVFASRVGHSCQANAEWLFSGGRFVLRTIQDVEANAPICISFGVNAKDTPDMFTRQATLSKFQMMCACHVCMADSAKCFCLACEHCGGPVPWHEKTLPNDLCMVCENKYQRVEAVKTVYQGMQTTQRAIWLLTTVDQDEYLPLIESRMANLACFIHVGNEQFQSMVRELCEQYFVQSSYREAVSWFQWLAHGNGVYLSPASTDLEGTASGNIDNILVRFHFFDQWMTAYLCHLETAGHELSSDEAFAHMTVANRLLSEMNGITKQWDALPPSATLQDIGQDQKVLGELLTKVVTEKTGRYTALARDVITDAMSRCLLDAHTGEQDGDLGLEPTVGPLVNYEALVGPDQLEIYSIDPEEDQDQGDKVPS